MCSVMYFIVHAAFVRIKLMMMIMMMINRFIECDVSRKTQIGTLKKLGLNKYFYELNTSVSRLSTCNFTLKLFPHGCIGVN